MTKLNIFSELPRNGLIIIEADKFMEFLDSKFDEFANRVNNQTPAPSAEKLLKSKEVEKILQVSAPTLIEWRKKGFLTARKIGNRVFYLESEVMTCAKTFKEKQK